MIGVGGAVDDNEGVGPVDIVKCSCKHLNPFCGFGPLCHYQIQIHGHHTGTDVAARIEVDINYIASKKPASEEKVLTEPVNNHVNFFVNESCGDGKN